jgi:hypothetical protein
MPSFKIHSICIKLIYPIHDHKYRYTGKTLFHGGFSCLYALKFGACFIIQGRWRCERCDQKRTLSLCWWSTAEKIVYIFGFCTGFIQKKTLSTYTGVLQIFHRIDTLRLVHGGSFDKILPKQAGYFGTRLNWKQLLIENREFGHNACSTTSQSMAVFHWSIIQD